MAPSGYGFATLPFSLIKAGNESGTLQRESLLFRETRKASVTFITNKRAFA
jgi:hypothetical protein